MKIKQGSVLTLVAVLSLWGTMLHSPLMAQESTSGTSSSQESSSGASSSNENVRGQIALSRSAIQTDRQNIVNQYMDLTEQESKDFWPLYREYRAKVSKLDDQVVELIINYGESYNNQSVSDEQAAQMLTDYLKLEEEELKLQKDYVKKFSVILPAKKVTRYFQLENKLDAIVEFDLAGNIPLVE